MAASSTSNECGQTDSEQKLEEPPICRTKKWSDPKHAEGMKKENGKRRRWWKWRQRRRRGSDRVCWFIQVHKMPPGSPSCFPFFYRCGRFFLFILKATRFFAQPFPEGTEARLGLSGVYSVFFPLPIATDKVWINWNAINVHFDSWWWPKFGYMEP